MTPIEDRLDGTGHERGLVYIVDFDEDAPRRLADQPTSGRLLQGGLAPWQEKRSKDMLAGDLTGATPLADIAGACRLSVSRFSRAFRRSTGLAPHAWLLQARVEAAKVMLRQRKASLPMIALACGFADQSHFNHVFARRTGLSPGAWRNTRNEPAGVAQFHCPYGRSQPWPRRPQATTMAGPLGERSKCEGAPAPG